MGPFGSVWLRFGSVSGPFRVSFGVLGGVRVGSGRGASVREKNITTLVLRIVTRIARTETSKPLTGYRTPGAGIPKTTAGETATETAVGTAGDTRGAGSAGGQQVLNLPMQHVTSVVRWPATSQNKRKRKSRCNFWNAALQIQCRSCTARLGFLECGCHFDQKLRCNKRKTAVQH